MYTHNKYSSVVIGGGLYGCMIALYLAGKQERVLLIEKEDQLCNRATWNNQARVHQGYHYPRSILTAMRSSANFNRFTDDFGECIQGNFKKYYAIGKTYSKISTQQFVQFCERIGAPLEVAEDGIKKQFNNNLIDEVFLVKEYAFNATILRLILKKRLESAGIEVRYNSTVTTVTPSQKDVFLDLYTHATETTISAGKVFNCCYSNINDINSANDQIPFKHQLAEVCLYEPSEWFNKIGITIMDGPFFSVMPFPAKNAMSVSHVRYTPHATWDSRDQHPYSKSTDLKKLRASHHVHMTKDIQRYIPAFSECSYLESLWEIKTMLPESNNDDSRPILLQHSKLNRNYISVMGGKIDNVYDVLDALDLKRI